MKFLQTLQRSRMSLHIVLFAFFALVLAACGSIAQAKSEDAVGNDINENEAVNEDGNLDENDSLAHGAEKIKYPSLISG